MPLRITIYLNVSVAIILVARLMALRLFPLYKVFALFLVYDLSLTLIYITVPWEKLHWDFRIIWLAERPLAWLLNLGVVYAMLQNIITTHSGILKASRRMLFASFAIAVIVAMITAQMEMALVATDKMSVMELLITRALVIERACITTSLILLGAMLVFLLWFPIEVSRNVALLCGGFLAYFAVSTTGLLLRHFLPGATTDNVNLALVLIQTACLLVWLFNLNQRGEYRKVRPGHSWKRQDRDKLIAQLDAINAALVRSARN